jgi:uncharacterized protein (TIGR02145 family)
MRSFLAIVSLFCLSLFSGLAQTTTNVGTEFWIAFPPNQSGSAVIEVYISSSVPTTGTISSAYPGVNQNFSVTPGIVTEIGLPTGVQLSSGTEDKGIHIVANDPIAVYGLNNATASTDAFLALPVNALGMDYRVLTYKTAFGGGGSSFAVAATHDATNVTIFNHLTGMTSNVTLNAGQTYYVMASNLNEDLTGSRVQADYPVSVFGAVKISQIPVGCTFADHIVEQLFPCYSWGKNYVTVPLAGRDNSGDIFRVLAAEDGTDVSVNGVVVATLNAGDYYEANLAGYNTISGSKAVMVCQYAKGMMCSGGAMGDPFMMLLLPKEQYLTDYTIINVMGVSPFSSHWVNLVAPDFALGTIFKDGILIPAGSFTQIGTSGFYGAQLSVTQGSHTFNSVHPFGVSVYGWRTVDSYGYPGGGSLSPVATVTKVTLTPDTLYGSLNITNLCLTAHVEDNLMNPVQGVLVNFHVSGINTLEGNGYTNASGDAQYCYTQTGTASGIDHVYAEAFGFNSDTSVVFWTYECDDPVTGGTIGSYQSGCGTHTPAPLTSISLPAGQAGVLEYVWQQSVVSSSSGFTDIAGSNSAGYSPGPISQDTWFRRLARVTCKPDWSGAAVSNVVKDSVIQPLPVSVSISASATTVCAGSPVTFTAFPVNGGTTPAYQWNVNGTNSGMTGSSFTYSPANGDQVSVILSSSEACISGNPATSNTIPLTVNPLLPVSVTIAATPNPFCPGASVTLTATPVNPGTAPQYGWKVNGVTAGGNSSTYSYVPVTGDVVTCTLLSNEVCATDNPAISAPVTLNALPMPPAGVTVSATPSPSCPGVPVTFTATPSNGGTSPSYSWKVNGVTAGSNNSSFIWSPASGDLVSVIMTSNLACVSNNPASSIPYPVSLLPKPLVTFTPCFDTITTTNAKPIKLKGGIPIGGTYSGPGVNPASGIWNPASAGTGTMIITYSYTNSSLCSSSATARIFNFQFSIFNCGNNLVDVRDNSVYPTVQIGSQCWMAANLNYGTLIPSNTHQRDNCIVEKYCYNDLTANCGLGTANYQWDELMRYDDTPGLQGLCPPGWHVPTGSDWNTLFFNWTNSSFAGDPLKVTGFSGFNAQLSGVRHMVSVWDFAGFAAFFWSSTADGPYKAWGHGMNNADPSVSFYPSSRSNAFSVRCLKD